MPNVLEMISDQDRLDFAQNYSIERNYVGDRLFPDVKTENLEAEYERRKNREFKFFFLFPCPQ